VGALEGTDSNSQVPILHNTYKTYFSSATNLIAQWCGVPGDKANFLRDIVAVREKTFNPRLIRNSFKERGIFSTDGSLIIEARTTILISAPTYRICEDCLAFKNCVNRFLSLSIELYECTK
jgi:hypothetical protein